MRNIIKVGMAELGIIQEPGILTTLGLGSCVGVILYDRVVKTGVWPILCYRVVNRLKTMKIKLNLRIPEYSYCLTEC